MCANARCFLFVGFRRLFENECIGLHVFSVLVAGAMGGVDLEGVHYAA